MGWTPAGLSALADGGADAAGTRITFHTADPGTTGANEIAGTGRPATTWAAAVDGARAGSQVAAPIPADTTVTHWGIIDLASGGTFAGGWELVDGGGLPAHETFGAAGTIQLTPTATISNPA